MSKWILTLADGVEWFGVDLLRPVSINRRTAGIGMTESGYLEGDVVDLSLRRAQGTTRYHTNTPWPKKKGFKKSSSWLFVYTHYIRNQ